MSIKRSIFEELLLESNDQSRTIDVSGGAISIDYYEDIFSPMITATVKVVNTGSSIAPEDNKDGEKQSIYNGLPLRGGERISMKISGNSATNKGLDFSKNEKDYFYVSSITDVISETQQESFTLHLVSREAITNLTTRVAKKYPTSLTIDESVRKILTDYLKTDKIGTLEKSSNKYGFIGNLRKPFTVLIWLASKAVPVSSGNGTAGFVFYQTQEGFQFRSIDGLIQQKPKATYTYSQATVNYDEESGKVENDFKILNYITERNQNLIEKLQLGTYSSHRMFFNPLDFSFSKYEEGIFKLEDYAGKAKNLGSQLKLPKISSTSNQTLGDTPTRILTAILDVGTMEKDASTDINSDPKLNQSQSLMRYNILFTQTLSVIVPCNTNLKAGDIIECQFPRISESETKEYDKEQSGLYMIKELCHHFDSENSYTSMKLVRDTFGINVEEKK